MNLQKDFDKLLDTIRTERDKLAKILKSLDEDNFEDYSYQLEAFRMAILPMIQNFADRIINWVKDSNVDDLKTLEGLCSQEDLTYKKFRSLMRRYASNYHCNRYLCTIAFLRDFDTDGLCQPVDALYVLLLGLYDRCYYLSSLDQVSDDSLDRFCGLFYGMI